MLKRARIEHDEQTSVPGPNPLMSNRSFCSTNNHWQIDPPPLKSCWASPNLGKPPKSKPRSKPRRTSQNPKPKSLDSFSHSPSHPSPHRPAPQLLLPLPRHTLLQLRGRQLLLAEGLLRAQRRVRLRLGDGFASGGDGAWLGRRNPGPGALTKGTPKSKNSKRLAMVWFGRCRMRGSANSYLGLAM